MKEKIFLIGFMGCGKTTHGKKLAKLMEKPFIDLDNYLEKKEEATVDAIFKNKGEDYFREKESEYLKQVVNRYASSVVSLGGGAASYSNNISLILNAGLVIYIEMPAESLQYRLSQSPTQRPLLADKSAEESLEFIQNLLRKRLPYYHQAHITLNGINLTPEKIKEAISLYSVKAP